MFERSNPITMNTKPEHSEGPDARAIEQQTAKLPSDLFLWGAGASILTSLTLKITGHTHTALFVGQWGEMSVMM